MATGIEKRGRDKHGRTVWRVVVDLPKGADGKRKRHYRTVHGSNQDARSILTALRTKLLRGENVGTAAQPLSEYLETWLTEREGQVSKRTWQRYASLLRSGVVPDLGHVRLGDLTAQHLSTTYARWAKEPRSSRPSRTKQVRSHKGKDAPVSKRTGTPLSPTTIHHRHVVLKMALADAVKRHKLIPFNPADDAVVPKPKRQELYILDETELAELLNLLADAPIGTLAYVAAVTGARLGEVLGLRWRDFDSTRGVITIRQTLVESMQGADGSDWWEFKEPKSGHGRTVDLDGATIERLREYKAAQSVSSLDGLLFTTATGEPMRPSSVSAAFRKIAECGGFHGLRFHDLRHAHATILLKAGQPPHVVARRLGHADVALTLRVYADVLPMQGKDAADAFADALWGKTATQ